MLSYHIIAAEKDEINKKHVKTGMGGVSRDSFSLAVVERILVIVSRPERVKRMSNNRSKAQNQSLDFSNLFDDPIPGNDPFDFDLENEQQIQNKIFENQRLGFKLAEEVRQLRQELLKEKQERRILLVTNENLNEQIKKLESKVRVLEQTHHYSEQTTERVEKIYEDEVTFQSFVTI
jgi:hypothetical protein